MPVEKNNVHIRNDNEHNEIIHKTNQLHKDRKEEIETHELRVILSNVYLFVLNKMYQKFFFFKRTVIIEKCLRFQKCLLQTLLRYFKNV